MIDNANLLPSQITLPNLTVVAKNTRQRDCIDRKRNYFAAKRLFDILFSGIFIVTVLSWLLPLVAILIKVSSRGPVFFRQKRIGRGGRSFTCLKLRTMVMNADADIRQAGEHDNRITKFGWFLRKSNIDEFPQFFNILAGSMSVVGPRPHMYTDCRNFAALLPGYKFRNMVKPGLTGMAQIKGYHGPTATKDSIIMRYHWDNYYIRNIGWVLDGKIIYRTIVQRVSAIGKFFLETAHLSPQRLDDITA
jgi:putative colanic acid biosynthesis UDP-glucose lipid carrier transferase